MISIFNPTILTSSRQKKIDQITKNKKEFTTSFKVLITSINNIERQDKYVEGVGWSHSSENSSFDTIINVKGNGNWYKDKIDQEWEVLKFDKNWFRVNNKWGCGFFFINKKDCKIIK